MPKYFFDFYDAQGGIVDDEGVDLPSQDAARSEARQTVGEAARALMAKGADGRVMVRVRDQAGPVLTVTAAFQTTDD